MRNASSALITMLNNLSPGQPVYVADLMTIQWPAQYTNMTDGPYPPSSWPVVARITSAPESLISKSQALSPSDNTLYTFTGGLVTFTRGQAHWNIGLQVDDMPVTIISDPTRDLFHGVPWSEAAQLGFLDGALITIERLFMTTWKDTSAGTLIMFKGTAADIQATRNTLQIVVKALINNLESPMPRNVYQPGCIHVLYDTGCALSKATFTKTGAAQSGSTARVINTNLTDAAHYFDLGTITFTGGANAGLTRGINLYSGSHVVTVNRPFPFVPANGDAFSIAPGCDKTPFTCNSRYTNLPNFLGFPNVPAPESAA